MTTTGHEATTHNAREGMEAVMARRSFYSVIVFSVESGCWQHSRTFSKKAAALKWARFFSAHCTTRVMEGGEGGMEVARFEKR